MEKPRATRSDPEDRRAYSRWHYQQNKDAYKARARAHDSKTKNSVRQFCREYAARKGCIDCGESDPIVLEFDHRDGVQKLFNIGDAASKSLSLKTVMTEIEKCDIRCANCHRRMTYRRSGRSHRG